MHPFKSIIYINFCFCHISAIYKRLLGCIEFLHAFANKDK